MVTIIEVIGIFSFFIAIYAIAKQRKFETKFKEKERLKILANRLSEVLWNIDDFSKIEDPTYDEQTQLQMLSQSIISKAFDKKKDIISISIETTISIEELTKNSDGKEMKKTNFIRVDKKEDVIRYLEKSEIGSFDIAGNLGEVCYNDGILSYSITDFFQFIPDFFYKLEELENEFGDLMEEFSPNLLNSLKDCIRDLLAVAIFSKEIKIDTKEFGTTDDIGLCIYNEIVRREEINSHLNKMVELNVKFQKLRENLVTTSYT